MNKDKLNEAARVEREKCINDLRKDYNIHKDIQHYAIASCCLEKYALGIFNNGANYLMQQPLADRLTEEEKKRIKEIYWQAMKDWVDIGEARGYCKVGVAIEQIFGAELFNEK